MTHSGQLILVIFMKSSQSRVLGYRYDHQCAQANRYEHANKPFGDALGSGYVAFQDEKDCVRGRRPDLRNHDNDEVNVPSI